jgi:hypothetical protein
MTTVYPHGPIAAPVLNKQLLQHDVVEDTNPTLIDLLAHRASDLGRDVLDRVAPAWTLVTGRWLRLDTALMSKKRCPPGDKFLNASTSFGSQSPYDGLMIHMGPSLQRVSYKELWAVVEFRGTKGCRVA